MVIPIDLVDDQLRVTFGIKSRVSYLYGDDHSGDESFILRLVVAGGECELQGLLNECVSKSIRTISGLLPFMLEAQSIDNAYSGYVPSFTVKLNFATKSTRACDLMLPLETY